MLPLHQLPVKSYTYPSPLFLSYYNLQTTPIKQQDKNLPPHPYYELVFFKEAQNLKYHLDFTPYIVEPGTLFFVQPRQIYFIEDNYNESNYELFVISFSEGFLDQIKSNTHYKFCLNEFFIMGKIKVDPLLTSYFVSIWRQMKEELIHRDHDYEQSNINHFLNLLILLKRYIIPLTSINIKKARVLDIFKNFQMLLGEHYHQQWSVSQYANALRLTTRKLHRICFAAKNTSPQVIIHNRLNTEAKRYLVNTDLLIKKIAFQLSFPNQSSFARFFNRNNKMSPEAFRLKMSQQYH